MSSNGLDVIELFAGAGLLSHAFAVEGFRVRRAHELNRDACDTYARNIGDHVVHSDLAQTSPSERCDVLVAGPPCQGFSTLGKRDPSDPRNALSLVIADWTRHCRPELVVVENVAAFVESPTWKQLAYRLRRQGYSVQVHVLDASLYGAAQYRLRSFTIASRRGTVQPEFKEVCRRRTVRQAWRGLAGTVGSGMNYAPKPSTLARERFRIIPQGGDKRDILRKRPSLAPPSWRRAPGAVTDVWGRMIWDEPSNTIRTAFQNPSKGRYIHPTRNRVITLREGARLQGIPDRWEFSGPPTRVAAQIGNGVPIPLGRAVARAVSELVFD